MSGDLRKGGFGQEDVARAGLRGKLTHCEGLLGPVEQLLHRLDLAIGDVEGQPGNIGDRGLIE